MPRLMSALDLPIDRGARLALLALLVPLGLTLVWPLWRIELLAPQYPGGLWLDIYAWTLKAGNEGQHLQEINILNHYIGMHPLEREALADLDWMPFGFGVLALLVMRVAAIGRLRELLDVTVLAMYLAAFAGARFVYRLYRYGHDLDPRAPLKIDPFMPPLFGNKQIGNFWSSGWPQAGSFAFAVFLVGLAVVLGWQMWRLLRQRPPI